MTAGATPIQPHESKASGRVWPCVTVVVALFLCLALPGIRWGLPSARRNALYFTTPESLAQSEAAIRAPGAPQPVAPHEDTERLRPTTRSLYNPVRSYHPDEYYVLKMLSRMRPWRLDVDPEWYVIGGAYVYPLGAALKALDAIGVVTLTPDATWYLERPDEMARLYLVGRALGFAAAVGAILFTMLAARVLCGRAAAVAAGLALALAPLVAMHAHFMYCDVAGMFWVSVATWAAARVFSGASRRNLIVAALAAGLAAGTKIHHGFALALVIAAVWALPGIGARRAWAWTAAVAGIALAAFLALNPFYVLRPSATLANFSAHVLGGTGFAFYLKTLGMGLGVTAVAVGAAGLVLALRMRNRALIVIGVWALAFYALISLFGKHFARFALPMFPACALMVGFAAARLRPKTAWAAGLALCAMLIPQLVSSVGVTMSMVAEDSRTKMGREIVNSPRFPAGATITVVEEPWQFEMPPIDLRRYCVVVAGRDGWLAASLKTEILASDLQEGFEPGCNAKQPNDLRLCAGLWIWRTPPEDMRYVSPEIYWVRSLGGIQR